MKTDNLKEMKTELTEKLEKLNMEAVIRQAAGIEKNEEAVAHFKDTMSDMEKLQAKL